MKLIKSQYTNDCGVASLAMILDISYRRAMKLLHPELFNWFFLKKKGDAITPVSTVLNILDKLGIKYIYVDNNNHNRPLVLNYKCIMIMKTDGKPWHAVVWCPNQKRAFDPNEKYYRGKYYWHYAILIDEK